MVRPLISEALVTEMSFEVRFSRESRSVVCSDTVKYEVVRNYLCSVAIAYQTIPGLLPFVNSLELSDRPVPVREENVVETQSWPGQNPAGPVRLFANDQRPGSPILEVDRVGLHRG